MFKTNTKKPLVICFGEMLWDNLPSGRTAGGAPMNVAYHLIRAGAESKLISRRGNDQAGRALSQFCKDIGLPTGLIQTDTIYPTGEVIGTLEANDEMVYDIRSNAAWDYIRSEPELLHTVADSDAFVFGSLAARNEISRNTLLQLLNIANFKVFDVNLRAPHYNLDVLEMLLNKADLLKLNEIEMPLLSGWFYKKEAAEEEAAQFFLDRFDIKEIIVTKGSEGAAYYAKDTIYEKNAYKVKVADTVGAGDSFLAAFLSKKLSGAEIPVALDYALATGALVAGKNGACPEYSMEDVARFME
jgi:fructokinase